MHDFVLMRVSKLGYRALIVFAFELISVRRQVGYLIIDLISYSCSTVSSRVVRSEPQARRQTTHPVRVEINDKKGRKKGIATVYSFSFLLSVHISFVV